MNFMNRYSIRRYKSDKIKDEWVKEILDAMLLSPSGKNKKPWEFILIDDRDLINELSVCKKTGAGFVKDAPLVILVLSLEDMSDTWIEDAAITLTHGHLKAHELGLGSCWVQVRNRLAENSTSEECVKNILQLSKSYRVVGFLTVGVPDENPTREKIIDYSKVHYNKIGEKYE